MPLMSPVGQSIGRMSSPPVPPPEIPAMSAYRPSSAPEGGGGPGPGQAGAIPQLFFQADQALDTIASAVPTVANDIDSIKSALRDVLRKMLSIGAPNQVPNPQPAGGEGMPQFGA